MLENINLKDLLILDIETVPEYPHFEEAPFLIKELWEKKNDTFKDSSSLAEETYSRAGIYAEFGKIICISFGMFSKSNEEWNFRIKSLYGHEERTILTAFAELLNKLSSNTLLCAHNGKEFDFPYICRRMLINGIVLPKILNIQGKKPWEINHIDTMDYWKFGDYKNYTSLNLLARVLGIPSPKENIKGSDVCRVYWEDNNIEKIKTYCEKDVVATARILMKFKYMEPFLDEAIVSVP